MPKLFCWKHTFTSCLPTTRWL